MNILNNVIAFLHNQYNERINIPQVLYRISTSQRKIQ